MQKNTRHAGCFEPTFPKKVNSNTYHCHAYDKPICIDEPKMRSISFTWSPDTSLVFAPAMLVTAVVKQMAQKPLSRRKHML